MKKLNSHLASLEILVKAQRELLDVLFWEAPNVLSQSADTLRSGVDAERVSVHLKNDFDTEKVTCELTASISADNQAFSSESIKPEAVTLIGESKSAGLVGWLAMTFCREITPTKRGPRRRSTKIRPRSLYTADLWKMTEALSEEEHHLLSAGKLCSVLAMPLISRKKQFLGLVVAWNKRSPDCTFTNEDANLIALAAAALAAIASHKQVRETVRLILQDMQIIRGVIPKGEERPHALFESIIEKACKLLGAKRGEFAWWSVPAEGLVYAATYGEREPDPSHYTRSGLKVDSPVPERSCMNKVFLQQEPDYRLIEDVSKLDPMKDDYAEASPNTRSELAVRVNLHHHAAGVLNVESFEPKWFDETDLAILRVIARHASIAVQMVRFEELVRNTMEHGGQPEDFLHPILNAILETHGFDEGIIYRWDETFERLVVAACKKAKHVNRPSTEFSWGKDDRSFAVSVFARGQFALTAEDPSKDDRVSPDGLRAFDINAQMAGYPLRFPGLMNQGGGNDRTVGVLVMWSRKRPFPDDFNKDRQGTIARLEPYARLAAAKITLWQAQYEAEMTKNRFEQLVSHERFPLRVFIKQQRRWQANENIPDVRIKPGDPKFVFIYANPTFRKDVGLGQKDSIENKTDWDFYPKEDAWQYYQGDRKVEVSKVFYSQDESNHPNTRPDPMKVEIWKLSMADPTTREIGQIEGVFWDRTEEWEIRGQLKEQAVAKERLFRDLRHRFHNDLQTVDAFLSEALQVLGDQGTNDPVAAKELLDDTRVRLQFVSLVHQYLYDTQLGERETGDVLCTAFLNPLLEALGELFQPKDAVFQVTLMKSIAPVKLSIAKAVAVGLILTECISNSVKHSRKHNLPSVTVNASVSEIENNGENLELLINDNGPGVGEGFKIDSLPAKYLGLRLMSVTAEMVLGGHFENLPSLHQGEPGRRGAVFSVKFSRAGGRVQREQNPYECADPRRKVLLVEDNIYTARVLADKLKQADYEVRIADSQEGAVKSCLDLNPTVVIMDIGLGDRPGDRWAGIEAARKIAGFQDRPPVEILLLTSLAVRDEELQRRIATLPERPYLISKRGPYEDSLIANVNIATRRKLQGAHVFICYAHDKDELALKAEMDEYLNGIDEPDEPTRKLIWSDKDLEAGQNWKQEISRVLDHCAVAICMVSQPFMNSKFIQEQELPRIRERCRTLGIKIYLIHTSPAVFNSDRGKWLSDFEFFEIGGEKCPPEQSIKIKSLIGLYPEKQQRKAFWAALAEDVDQVVQRTRTLIRPADAAKHSVINKCRC